MKICIFRGTFNPIHTVHLAMAMFAKTKLGYDTVIFVPAYKPPYQDIDDELANHRYNLVKIAIGGNTNFQISNIEFQHEKYSLPHFVVEEIAKRYGAEGKVGYILGTDTFREVDGWWEADKLKKAVHFIVYPRTAKFNPDNYKRFTEWGYDFEFANMKFMDVSSTVIRHRVKTGKPLGGLVTQPVLEYIKKNGLYLPYNE